MGTIIQWADWVAVQEAIRQTSQAVSGMSPSEAEAALNWTKTNLKDGTIRYIYNASSGAAGTNIVQFPGASASDAFNSYIGDGGLSSPGGAAVSNPSIAQSSNLTMLKGASGTAGIGAILSVNLPTVAAAIAPLAGVAIGEGLYKLNPDFWEKISRALLPFCYDGTDLLPVIADGEGNTYFPKNAVDALKEILTTSDKTGVITDTTSSVAVEASKIIKPFPFTFFRSSVMYVWKEVDDDREFVTELKFFDEPLNILSFTNGIGQHHQAACSDKPFIVNQGRYPGKYDPSSIYTPQSTKEASSKIVNGKTIYYTSGPTMGVGSLFPYPATFQAGDKGQSLAQYLSLFGSEIVASEEGLTIWDGAAYPSEPNSIDVITSIDNGALTTQPYYPITMPIGDPGISVSPDNIPDITTNPNPAPAINPWITPNPSPATYPLNVPSSNPAPIPDPVPDYTPNLDPDSDPSQEPAQEPDPAEQTPKPGDIGTSPTPQIPVIPSLPSAATGLLHIYNPTQAQLDSFGSWLWTTFSGDLIDTLSKLFNDPMDAVIGLHELYTTPAVSGQATIRAGYLDSGVSSNIVGSRYSSINCGSVVVPEFYSNYLDYSPYTKCYIYLPFVGIVPVLADDIIGNGVNITYHVDSYTGCCIAVVTVAREGYSSTVYQFEGNCGVEIPITSGYQSTLVGAMLGIAGTAISGSPHVGLAASNLGRANLGKNDASHSGSFGASYGAMGAKIPYIIVKRPTQKSVVNYNEDYGFPAHTRVTIGACSGYLRAREVHVISPTATDEEKARIEELLKGGVFVK